MKVANFYGARWQYVVVAIDSEVEGAPMSTVDEYLEDMPGYGGVAQLSWMTEDARRLIMDLAHILENLALEDVQPSTVVDPWGTAVDGGEVTP